MKNIFRLFLILQIAAMSVSCFPDKKLTGPDSSVSALTDTTRIRNGSLVYALPRTVFNIRVEMERELKIPGPYARYAEDMLGLRGVIMNAGEHWTVSGITVTTHEEADPSEFYVIETTSLFTSNSLILKKEGLILDINPASDNNGDIHLIYKDMNIDQFHSTDLGSDEYYTSQNDTAYRRVAMDSTFIRVPYIVEKKKKLSTDQLAERAARKLMDLRDGKFLILTGEANVFPQSPDAINEINRLEKDYLELFTGKTINEKRSFSYQVIPDRENGNNQKTLFVFSADSGPADLSVEGGIPVKIAFEAEKKTKDLTILSRQQPVASGQSADKLYYRIPDVANIKILVGAETIFSSRKLVYQFGEVMQLPANYIIGK